MAARGFWRQVFSPLIRPENKATRAIFENRPRESGVCFLLDRKMPLDPFLFRRAFQPAVRAPRQGAGGGEASSREQCLPPRWNNIKSTINNFNFNIDKIKYLPYDTRYNKKEIKLCIEA